MIVFLQGPINAGKSTVGRLLAIRMPDAIFFDGDDFGPAGVSWHRKVDQVFKGMIAACRSADAQGRHAIVAYPMQQEFYSRLCQELHSLNTPVFCITLAPPMAAALENRGTRSLSAAEKSRIHEMYAEGYQTRSFSDLILDNVDQTADQTVDIIRRFLSRRLAKDGQSKSIVR